MATFWSKQFGCHIVVSDKVKKAEEIFWIPTRKPDMTEQELNEWWNKKMSEARNELP